MQSDKDILAKLSKSGATARQLRLPRLSPFTLKGLSTSEDVLRKNKAWLDGWDKADREIESRRWSE